MRADLRDVPLVLPAPAVRQLIDFRRPVGVLMISVLQWLSDSDDAAGVVARYRDAVPAGSYLTVSRPTTIDARASGGQPGAPSPDRGRSRTREEIGALFAGWQLQAPGLVTLDEWRSDLGATVATEPGARPHLAAVGRKP